MRTLLAIVILAVLGWSGWWYFQATARDRALTGWLEEPARRRLGGGGRGRARHRLSQPRRCDRDRPRPRRSGRGLVLAGRGVPGAVALLQAAPHHRRAPRRAGGGDPVRDAAPDQRAAARLGDLPADPPAGARPFDLRDRQHADRERQRLDRRHRQGDLRHPPGRRARRAAVRPRRRLQRRAAGAAAAPDGGDRRRRRAAGGDQHDQLSTRRWPSTAPGTAPPSKARTRRWSRSTSATSR